MQNGFKDNNYDKWILARDGEKALSDKVEPYIKRDASLLKVGDVLIADVHKLAFQVINPFTGELTRATLIGYFRTSGFYRLYKSLDNIEKIRILVGLNVDRQTLETVDGIRQEKLDFDSQRKIKDTIKICRYSVLLLQGRIILRKTG